jgi:hypothetical protein
VTLPQDLILWRVPSEGAAVSEVGRPDGLDCRCISLLMVCFPSQGDGYAVRLVEVKGPGDNLSWAQRAWIDRLLALGVDVKVARVTDAAAGRRNS